MSNFWKKATFPTIEDLAKEVSIKKQLTLELRNSIRSLQSENVGKNDVIESCDSVVTALEAIFIHGLKGKFSVRMSSVFSSGPRVKIPEPDFWPVVLMYSHKDVLACISKMRHLVTNVGRCRAWLRMAMNDGLICSYVDTMIADKSSMPNFYTSVAYLRDIEQPDIMKQVLEGLCVFNFQLSCDSSSLNVWNSSPLVLAGIWTPPANPQPVMPGLDANEYFSKQEDQADAGSSRILANDDSDKPTERFRAATPQDIEPKVVKVTSKDVIEEREIDKLETFSGKLNEFPSVNDVDNHEIEKEQDTSDVSSSCSAPDVVSETMTIPIIPNSGSNRLWRESGWSSEFDSESTHSKTGQEDQESYDSLLQSYNRNRPPTTILVGTPDLGEMMSANISPQTPPDCEESGSVESKSSISDYEIVPRLTLEGSDKRTQHLLSVLGKICPEQGLDMQDYKCRGCGCAIGMIYGKAYLCHLDGFSYCSECHIGEEYFIPARIIHNWDFKKYSVAKFTKTFLLDVEQVPLLNIKDMNPLIYTAIEEMAHLQLLRTQLTFLRSYIFTCKESIIEELRKKIWPREYLYEHVHLYSLTDLLQVITGTLQQTLQKIITFAKKHVLGCHMCSLKAFICEICNSPKVIYPFDTDVAYHCEQCLAVYHHICREAKKFCPKCERKRKRDELTDSWCLD